MDEVIKQAGLLLVANGPIGILCILLCLALRRIFNLYEQVQEKRIQEKDAAVAALNNSTKQLQEMSVVLREVAYRPPPRRRGR